MLKPIFTIATIITFSFLMVYFSGVSLVEPITKCECLGIASAEFLTWRTFYLLSTQQCPSIEKILRTVI